MRPLRKFTLTVDCFQGVNRHFRVTEVLDEDNLVQEVMHRNSKLISFLCKEETLKEMIELIVKDSAYEEVSLDDTDRYEEIQRRFKRANQAMVENF